MGSSTRSSETSSTRTFSTGSSSSSSFSSSSSISFIVKNRPKTLPFENIIIANLLKSVFYLGRGNNVSKKNPEYYKKNKRICEVIDILRYEDDGTLLKKFIKSDTFLIKYLGFDYKHEEHDSSDDSSDDSESECTSTVFTHDKRLFPNFTNITDPADLKYKGFNEHLVNGGYAPSRYRHKDRINLRGALPEEIIYHKHDYLFKSEDDPIIGEVKLKYPRFNKSDINGGNAANLYDCKNIVDLRGATEVELHNPIVKKINVKCGRAVSDFPIEDQVDLFGAGRIEAAELKYKDFHGTEINGGDAIECYTKKVDLKGALIHNHSEESSTTCSHLSESSGTLTSPVHHSHHSHHDDDHSHHSHHSHDSHDSHDSHHSHDHCHQVIKIDGGSCGAGSYHSRNTSNHDGVSCDSRSTDSSHISHNDRMSCDSGSTHSKKIPCIPLGPLLPVYNHIPSHYPRDIRHVNEKHCAPKSKSKHNKNNLKHISVCHDSDSD